MKKIFLIPYLLFICLITATAFADDNGNGTISGKVMISDGVPMSDGSLFIFNEASGAPPSFDRYWRVPDEIATIDKDGKFNVLLSAGRYYLGAIKRKTADEAGPLQDGDLFLPFYADGAPIAYPVTRGSSTNLGVVTGVKPFSKAILKTGEGITAILGIVTDSHGKPLENVMVLAFNNASMLGRPLFISEMTGKDGRYMLRLYEGGDYYLKIRSSYGGGAMKAGEIMGNYGADKPAPVAVKSGAVTKGIDIVGTIFSGQGAKYNRRK